MSLERIPPRRLVRVYVVCCTQSCLDVCMGLLLPSFRTLYYRHLRSFLHWRQLIWSPESEAHLFRLYSPLVYTLKYFFNDFNLFLLHNIITLKDIIYAYGLCSNSTSLSEIVQTKGARKLISIEVISQSQKWASRVIYNISTKQC